MKEYPIETLLEATLFGAGKSLTIEELSGGLDRDSTSVEEGLATLQNTLKRRRGGALQLVKIGERWALEVKPKISQHLPGNAKTEIAPKLLKAAALIAYHQPMIQSRLVELLGQKAYDYVRELANLGLIERRRSGNTRKLSTTRRFSEVFGCPHTDRKKVRKWFREKVSEVGLTKGVERPIALEKTPEDGQMKLPLDELGFTGLSERATENMPEVEMESEIGAN